MMPMAAASKSFKPSVDDIDLMHAHFEWQAQVESEKRQKYSAAATVLVEEEKSQDDAFFSAGVFCDFSLSRQGYKSGNFDLSATYYAAITCEDREYRLQKEYVKRIVKTLVWSRFFEFARFALSQAGMKDVEIPIEPESISLQMLKA
jgi:hypothetical protein